MANKKRRKLSQSAQARWARKQVAMGKCRICGGPRAKYKVLCDGHQMMTTVYMRKWRAAKKEKANGAAAEVADHAGDVQPSVPGPSEEVAV